MASASKNSDNEGFRKIDPKAGVRQQIAIDLIKVDWDLQPRVIQIDMEHVGNISQQFESGVDLPPALLVYRIDGKFYLVDGFHRWKALMGLRFKDPRSRIYTQPWCIVHEGTREEAIEAAIAANIIHTAKTYSSDDKRNCCEKLMNDPRWQIMTDGAISKYLKMCNKSVKDCRNRWREQNGVDLPEFVEAADGRRFPTKRRKTKSVVLPRLSRTSSGTIVASVDGKKMSFGVDPDKAVAAVRDLMGSIEEQRKIYSSHGIKSFFVNNYIVSDSAIEIGSHNGYPGMYGRQVGSDVACTWEPFQDKINAGSAAARALWLKQRIGSTRTVVLCPVDQGPTELMDDFRKMGVEWMTIDDFVASLKPTEGEGSPDPSPDPNPEQ